MLPVKSAAADSKFGSISQHGAGSGYQIQLAEDLSSPRFAGDKTLENIFDGSGTLKEGDESDSVRKVQHAIHDAGFLFLDHGADKKFGPETTKQVRKFQKKKGVAEDPKGEVGAINVATL